MSKDIRVRSSECTTSCLCGGRTFVHFLLLCVPPDFVFNSIVSLSFDILHIYLHRYVDILWIMYPREKKLINEVIFFSIRLKKY